MLHIAFCRWKNIFSTINIKLHNWIKIFMRKIKFSLSSLLMHVKSCSLCKSSRERGSKKFFSSVNFMGKYRPLQVKVSLDRDAKNILLNFHNKTWALISISHVAICCLAKFILETWYKKKSKPQHRTMLRRESEWFGKSLVYHLI